MTANSAGYSDRYAIPSVDAISASGVDRPPNVRIVATNQ
jgi:hypothetical protein